MMHQAVSQQLLQGNEIFVVDDDELMLDMLAALLEFEGGRVTRFAQAASFLVAARMKPPACILLDVNMPDRSGLEMLRELDAPSYPAPILVVSGQRDVPTAVNAIKNGALDFIEKPFDTAQIIAKVHDAIAAWARRDAVESPQFPGCGRLTHREHEVLVQITGGASNKEAGRRLGISPRTVEVHRARIMDKLGARNAADLVRTVLCVGAARRPALGAMLERAASI